MSTTISMWLGIAFLFLAIAATIIQAWLWSFPMVPDPGGPDPNGKSTAPRAWTLTHRAMGLAYVIIYVVLMWEMVPRLWEYQFELPARTVIHACMGILIGILLVTKISIIRWFQHFGKSLPSLGLSLLACTIILATLSIPFAIRAHDFGDALRPENLERVKRALEKVEWEEQVDVARLATEETFEKGLEVLTGKCTGCHDIRTILYKPRSAENWYATVKRMVKKPTIGDRLLPHELPAVTAYLVAITPEIQESQRLKNQGAREQAERVASLRDPPASPAEPATPAFDEAAGIELLRSLCTDCHEMDQIDDHGKDDADGWSAIVTAMVEEQEAELSEEDARRVIQFLSTSEKYSKR